MLDSTKLTKNLKEKMMKDYPNYEREDVRSAVIGYLAELATQAASTDEATRTWAINKIRIWSA